MTEGTRIGYNIDPDFTEAVWSKRVVSTTNTVEVHFYTDGSVTDKGWRLEWGE